MTPTDQEVEAVAVRIERELDLQEMILADPITVRKIRARRIARAAIAALDQVRGK